MAATTHSSKPGVDHAGALYSLVQSNSGASFFTYFGATQQPSHPPNLSYPAPLHYAPPVPPNMNILAGGQYPPVVLQQPPPASSYPPPEVHLPSLPSDDDDAENTFSFDRRLGDPAEDDDMILDDASPVAGKKHQLPSTPSPPPNVPELFEVPAKTPASAYNSRLAFRAQKPSSRGS